MPLVAAIVLHALLVDCERQRHDLSDRAGAAAVVIVAVAAAATAPFGSHDLYQYAFYGRMAAFFGADPSVVAPEAFHHDPLFASLAPGWHGARTVYGPVFTWFSAVGARAFGTSPLGARLWFQSAAAAALVASARIVRHRTGMASALAVGLSPVLVAAVNGGHNDLLVGLVVVLAVDLAARDRPAASGAALALATCIKLSAAPVLLAFVLVAVARRAWRPLAAGSAAWALGSFGAYALGGGLHLLGPVAAIGSRTSRASAWGVAERVAGGSGPGQVVLGAGTLVAAALVAGVAWRWREAPLASAVSAVGATACFAAPYVLAWYPATVLPVSGLTPRSRATVVLHVGASVLLLAYVVPAGSPPGAVALAPTVAVACGVVFVVLTAILIGGPAGRSGYRRRGGQPRSGARRRGDVPGVSSAGGVARAGGAGEAGGVPR